MSVFVAPVLQITELPYLSSWIAISFWGHLGIGWTM